MSGDYNFIPSLFHIYSSTLVIPEAGGFGQDLLIPILFWCKPQLRDLEAFVGRQAGQKGRAR